MSQLVVELFEQDAGVKLLHVPYRGTRPALNDVLAGQVAVMVPDLSIALGQMKSGLLRAYGVTSATRVGGSSRCPDFGRSRPAGFEAVQWFGLAAPAGTPPDIVKSCTPPLPRRLTIPR